MNKTGSKTEPLKLVTLGEKRSEDALEIIKYAENMVKENKLDQVFIIVGRDDVYPQALMANLTEVRALGMLSFSQGLLQNSHTTELPDAPTPEED